MLSARAIAVAGLLTPLSARAVALEGLVAVVATVVVEGAGAVSTTSSGVAAAVAPVPARVAVQAGVRGAASASAQALAAVDRSAVAVSLVVPVGAATVGAVGATVAVGYAARTAAVVVGSRGANVSAALIRAVAAADVGARAATVANSIRAAAVQAQARSASLRTSSLAVHPMAFTITRGDALPELPATLTAGGSAQNLTGVLSVTLLGKSPTGVSWTKEMSVVSAAAGTVKAAFTTSETAALEVGSHRCWIKVVFADGRPMTFPEGETGIEVVIARGPGS